MSIWTSPVRDLSNPILSTVTCHSMDNWMNCIICTTSMCSTYLLVSLLTARLTIRLLTVKLLIVRPFDTNLLISRLLVTRLLTSKDTVMWLLTAAMIHQARVWLGVWYDHAKFTMHVVVSISEAVTIQIAIPVHNIRRSANIFESYLYSIMCPISKHLLELRAFREMACDHINAL